MTRTAIAALVLSGCGGLSALPPASDEGSGSGDLVPADADADIDADADADGDSDLDPIDTADPTTTTTTDEIPCGNFPNVPLANLTAGSQINPSYLAVRAGGIVDAGNLEDYTLYDVDGGSPLSDESAFLAFDFYNAMDTYLCSVVYDLSQAATGASGWTGMAPVTLWDAWDLTLTGAETDCGPLAPAFPIPAGTAPALVEQYLWTIGFGPMTNATASYLEGAIGAADWAADWDPYVFSMYMATDIVGPPEVIEFGYVFELESYCENVLVDASYYGTTNPVPSGALAGYPNVIPLTIITFQ